LGSVEVKAFRQHVGEIDLAFTLIIFSECDKDGDNDDHRVQISRLRRTIDSDFSQESQIGDLQESRIEGLEDSIAESRREISSLRRKLTRLSRRVTGSRSGSVRGDRVCVDFEGDLRMESETWIHESGRDCAECECKVTFQKARPFC